jgi:hypothetical protein
MWPIAQIDKLGAGKVDRLMRCSHDDPAASSVFGNELLHNPDALAVETIQGFIKKPMLCLLTNKAGEGGSLALTRRQEADRHVE